MSLGDLLIVGIVCLWLLDVVGWFVALFFWAIPVMSIGLDQVLSLSLGTIVGLILFFTAWLFAMIAGIILAIMVLAN